jgi:hypothetical protein
MRIPLLKIWLCSGDTRGQARDGTAEVTACVGDGVATVLATADGAVWVSYRDMGVLGNNAGAKTAVRSRSVLLA